MRRKKRYAHIVIDGSSETMVECFKSEVKALRFITSMYKGAIERQAVLVPDYYITRKELL